MSSAERISEALDIREDEETEIGLRPPFLVREPSSQRLPFVFSSPHSGRHYPDDLLSASALDAHTLRSSEDYFVEELFGEAPTLGAPLIEAVFARAYLDVNREAWELDQNMFADILPHYVNTRSGRVSAGLGTIARVVASGTEIYEQKLSFEDAHERIGRIYKPYHQQLEVLLRDTETAFGCAVLIDCHSMPSAGLSWGNIPLRKRERIPDFILGDRYGRSCAPGVIEQVEKSLIDQGYYVTRNDPYSGGFNTRYYGTPSKGRHALQIEINRALYINEETLEPTAGFKTLRADLTRMIADLRKIDPAELGV